MFFLVSRKFLTVGNQARTISYMPRPHVNHRALDALLARSGEMESHVAKHAGISAGHLHDLKTGRNLGTNSRVRDGVAEALGLPAEAFTCYCGRPDGACLNARGPREGVA